MRACDGAEICEILDLFLLYNLENKPKKKQCFWFIQRRQTCLIKNVNGDRADEIRKEFCKSFKGNTLPLEIANNLKTLNYLDIALDLRQLQSPCKYSQTTAYMNQNYII